ncbi:MAG TPA: cyanophycin synthetase [Candidatus Acidoferrum sp.]|nr:cyanophycin synthetase [Candidatus Acidoferrum sp.]
MTRSSSAIGAGLLPARPARPIVPGERIHVVGAAGAGASAAAILAAGRGAIVDGCDPAPDSQYVPAVLEAGIGIEPQHDVGHIRRVPPPDRLAVSKALTAVDPDNAELRAAREAGIAVEPWQQVVADAAAGQTLIGVAGTHGKSTTAGWLVHLLVSAGEDPSAFVGALLPASISGGLPATARRGSGSAFVVEADEYAGNFDPYRPNVAVVTNVEWDHPDVFADRDAVVDAFATWLGAAAEGGRPPVLVANVGDPGAGALLEKLGDWPGRVLATALVDAAPQRLAGFARGLAEQYASALGPATSLLGRVLAADEQGTMVEVAGLDPLAGPIRVRLPTAGRHNAANALGVAGAALSLGVAPDRIATGLASFPGIGRRLERKGEARGVLVYDDYGHHPTAIRETLAAVRQRHPDRRVWAVYEPLTFHRTAALLDDFAAALGTADAVAVADIWPGRDPDTTVASAAGLAAAVAARRPELEIGAPGSVEDTADWLAGRVHAGDVVLVMGGGRSYRIGERLLSRLAA